MREQHTDGLKAQYKRDCAAANRLLQEGASGTDMSLVIFGHERLTLPTPWIIPETHHIDKDGNAVRTRF